MAILRMLSSVPYAALCMRPGACSIAPLAALAICLASPLVQAAESFQMPSNLDQGWGGSLEFGARASYGATDSSAVSANSDFTYRGDRLELELSGKWYRSSSESVVNRRDSEGNDILDPAGNPVQDLVESTTNDRRTAAVQPRWFLSRRYYLFAFADVEINKPADIERATRQVTGIGYKLWKSRSDYASAAVGVGHKQLDQVSGEQDRGAIGYLGLRFKRSLTDVLSVNLQLDTDFGGESRTSEATVSVAWKVRDPVSIKFKYEARDNSNIVNPLNTFDEGVEAALGISVEVDVFP